ncbi:MAG: 4Fe-4S binding protein [bacterium]|nr:4Fe-4S binding protein [bacterium]
MRRRVQILSAMAANLPALSFLRCCPYPFLHCHACPLAIGACPVGVLQHFVILRRLPLYLVGAGAAVAALWGRASCAFLCPFGLLQEWLRELGDRLGLAELPISNRATWTRWIVLAVLVLGLPVLLREPWFCKLCPNGTLLAGIPLVITDPGLRSLAGTMFLAKVGLLAAVIGLALVAKRPFCRFACPFGALLGLGNRAALFHLEVDRERCTGCDECRDRCPMDLTLPGGAGSPGCIQCRQCTVCPAVRAVRGWKRPD